MKQKLTLLLLALVTSLGAWATTYQVVRGSQVTDFTTLTSSKYYVLRNSLISGPQGTHKYNYYNGSSSCFFSWKVLRFRKKNIAKFANVEIK